MTETPLEAMNEFYRLKDKYETSYYEKYVKPIVRSKASNREKRLAYSRLPKHECINCKRNVGTIFSIKNDDENILKIFSAKCGDTQEPCPLAINIQLSQREPIDIMINDALKSVEKIKMNIIKEKNNALFFNKDVVSLFESLTQELKAESEHTGVLIETNILRNENPEKKEILKNIVNEFSLSYLVPFKKMVKEYDDTNNELIMNQAVNFYINEMMPKLKEILTLKYDVNIVEYNELTNIYTLVQKPNSLENNEFYYKADDKVISFAKGLKKESKKTRKQPIVNKAKTNTNVKTKKIKPNVELILEEDMEQE
jgi:hypothetical protein